LRTEHKTLASESPLIGRIEVISFFATLALVYSQQ
jgi:hypothetical protein